VNDKYEVLLDNYKEKGTITENEISLKPYQALLLSKKEASHHE
jgi:alpha-glucosidase